jgi:hypothetical protein
MAATIIAEAPPELAWRMHPSKLSVVAAVTRRLLPFLIEATLIPALLFYAFLITVDLQWAFVAALVWCYTMVARRIFRGRPIPGLLVLGCLGITVRTMIYLLSANAFVYFVQPILRTLVTAATFGLSVVSAGPSREVRGRLLSPQPRRPGEAGHRAAVSTTHLPVGCGERVDRRRQPHPLLTVPTAVFVGTATVAAWAISCTGVVLTVSDSVRTARSEGLATAIEPNGALRAYAVTPD